MLPMLVLLLAALPPPVLLELLASDFTDDADELPLRVEVESRTSFSLRAASGIDGRLGSAVALRTGLDRFD